MPPKPGLILLGRIAAAHGIRGDVLIKAFTQEPDGIAAYGPLTDETGTRSLKIKVRRVTPKGVIAGIAGVDDRNAAEALKGLELFVAREKLPEPDEDEIYHADLIGLTATDEAGTEIGKIVNVENFGGGDLLELRLTGKRSTELVPFTHAHVPVVDIATGRLVIRWPLTFEVAAEEDRDPADAEGGHDDSDENGEGGPQPA
jgi:16S rRNA processing protein RimM